MMNRLDLWAVAFTISGLLTLTTLAAPPKPAPSTSPHVSGPEKSEPYCLITIENEKKDGDVEREIFAVEAKTPQQCEKEAALHKPNFASQWVKKKTVRAQFVPAQLLAQPGEEPASKEQQAKPQPTR